MTRPLSLRIDQGLCQQTAIRVLQGFGAVIRELCDAHGWSQERLAADAGVNRSHMGEIERASAVPWLATAGKLAEALGMALSALIARCESRAVDA